MEQHYRITLEQAISLYQSGNLTAKGALRFYFLIRLKPGWECRVKAKDLQDLFQMKRSTFWTAMNALVEEGFLNDWQENQTVTVSLASQNSGQSSKILDSYPENETVIQNSGQLSNKVDEQEPETLPEEECTNPSNSSQISSQTSINSPSPLEKFLSTLEGERDDFLNFCKTTTSGYPVPIINLMDYLNSKDATGTHRFNLLYKEWHKAKQLNLNGNLNPEIKGVDLKVIKSTDDKTAFIDHLRAVWGNSKFKQLISTIHDGWVYFTKFDDPQPFKDLARLTPMEIEAIALGGGF